MAQRKLRSPDMAERKAASHLRIADPAMTSVPSPAHLLHASLNEQFSIPTVQPLPVGQRLAIISVLASLSWAVVGCGLWLVIH